MKNRRWIDIAIAVDDKFQEQLIGKLATLGFNGFLQNDDRLNCYIPAPRWTVSTHNEFRLSLRQFKEENALSHLRHTVTSIREENWNRAWEKQTGIVRATPAIVIKPSWKKLPAALRNHLILHIDPKMSFGTGHHETTRLCLRLLEQFVEPKSSVLDFGCGTGILGIASVKLGARHATAVDHDSWSIENTRENIKRNNVQHRVITRLGSISAVPKRKYDLVVANLDARTIERFISSLSRLTSYGGTMILAGILISDIEHLLPKFNNLSLIPLHLDCENEWVAVALKKIRRAPLRN